VGKLSWSSKTHLNPNHVCHGVLALMCTPPPLSPQSVTSAQGTTASMAPEQHRPRVFGITPAAADIWAFCTTMAQCWQVQSAPCPVA
jgi:hypothetical protein